MNKMRMLSEFKTRDEVNYLEMIPRSEFDITKSKLHKLIKFKNFNIDSIADYFNCSREKIKKYIFKFDLDYIDKEIINDKLKNNSARGHLTQIEDNNNYKSCYNSIKFKCECGERFNKSWHNIQQNMKYHNGIFVCPSILPYGEYLIDNFLDKINIEYEKERKFNNLEDKGKLRFDFAVYNNNLGLIEHDGKYHNSVENIVQKHDKMKNEYCKQHDIPLLRISTYTDIEEKVGNFVRNL